MGLLHRSSPVIVALSGGADSVALLSVLVALGYNCIAAHCNFHLRGKESVRDMRHAEKIARQLGVDIYIRDFDVPKQRKKTGESVEMACRTLRYDWFHQLLDRDYSQAVAVAHHREDNIETFFLNLLRSTGIAGLTGMDFRRGYIVRPMLDVTRAQIERYLADVGLDYVVDSSNSSNDFKRNKLRNVLLPSLEENFPGAADSIVAVMNHLRDARLIVDHVVRSAAGDFSPSPRSLDVEALLSAHGHVRGPVILFEILRPRGFTASQCSDVVKAVAAGSTGLRFELPDGRFAELDRGVLSFHPDSPEIGSNRSYSVSLKHDILVPVNIKITPHGITEFKPERNPSVMYLDVSVLEDDPVFEIRHPHTGDRFRPFGMSGEKLVSDILKDAKFTAAQKRSVWLLTRNDRILWIIGLRASSLFSITPLSRRFLRLSLLNSIF